MHVAIDARELVGQVTGAGRYLGQLLAHWSLHERAQHHRFSLFAHAPVQAPGGHPGFETHVLSGSGGTRWEQTTLAAALGRVAPDVIFAPAYTSPLISPAPVVLSVHDVSFAAHPEWFRPRERWRRRLITKAAARRAATIITLSEFSRREIARYLAVPPERIRVIAPGVGLGDQAVPADAAATGPVILFVGSVFNRRHVPELVRALPLVVARYHDARLVIVGDNRTWPAQDLAAVARSVGVSERVSIASFVSDQELHALYWQASVFVFLSEYEGFGLTPLEALAHGVPVLVLDTPVAREIYGSAAAYVSEPRPVTIAAGILQLLDHPSARRQLLSEAPAVLARYRWDETAIQTLDVLEEACRS
jgi:glycosyltransferase involved in cell wall biosynthesis